MAVPSTTIVPFRALPSCAADCGPLWDANGACVPPVKPSAAESVYAACFCNYDTLQPFSQGAAGVCDQACTAQPAGTTSIQAWFTSYCNNVAGGVSSTPGASGSPSSSPSSGSGSGAHGSWISTHYQWVIMIVIVILGIAGIWAGACIWRRKYLRKKDRMYELGKGLPSSVAVNTQGNVGGPGTRDSYSNQPGMFMSGTGQPEPKANP